MRGWGVILDVMGSHWKAISRAPSEDQTVTECREHWWCPLDSFHQASVPKLQLLWLQAINASQLTLLQRPARRLKGTSQLVRKCLWGDELFLPTQGDSPQPTTGGTQQLVPLPQGGAAQRCVSHSRLGLDFSLIQGLAKLLPLPCAASLTPSQVSRDSVP